MQQQEASIDVRDLVWRVRRHRFLPFLPIVIAVCAALVYLKITPRLYESYVVVSFGDETPVSAALQPLISKQETRESFRDKVSRVNSRIHSRSFLGGMVRQLGLHRNPELLLAASSAARRWRGVTADDYAMRLASTYLGRQILVSPTGQSLIRISAVDRDPYWAQKLALTIADALIEEGRRTAMERVQARGEFSADQIAVYEERLRKSEAALRDYQESIIGRKLASNLVTEDNLDEARSLLRSIDEESGQIRGRIESDLGEWQRRSGSGDPPPDLATPRTAELESRLTSLETGYALASLKPSRSRGSDELASIEQKIGLTRQALLREYEGAAENLPGNVPAMAREVAAGIALDRAQVRSLRDKGSRVRQLIGEYSQTVQQSPRQDLELDRLRQEVTTNRDLLLALRKEATSTRISEALETSQLGLRLEIVETPQLPLGPFYPDRSKILMTALVAGVLLGAGVVLAMEKLGAVIRTIEQAELEIGARVIGTVPRIDGWARPGSYLQRHWPLLSIVLVLLVTGLFFAVYGSVVPEQPWANKAAGLTR